MTSPAEQLLSVQLEQAGIPFSREYAFAAPKRRWRADFRIITKWKVVPNAYPEPGYETMVVPDGGILIEVEGGAYVTGRHTRGAGFEKDTEKYNAAAELGYTVLRYTPRAINDGSALEQIRRILSMKEDQPHAAA